MYDNITKLRLPFPVVYGVDVESVIVEFLAVYSIEVVCEWEGAVSGGGGWVEECEKRGKEWKRGIGSK